jgi:hypothetical protein
MRHMTNTEILKWKQTSCSELDSSSLLVYLCPEQIPFRDNQNACYGDDLSDCPSIYKNH